MEEILRAPFYNLSRVDLRETASYIRDLKTTCMWQVSSRDKGMDDKLG